MPDFHLHFAPLQGYTDLEFRNAHARYYKGIQCYYSPFVRIEKGAIRKQALRDIAPAENQVSHFIPQIIAASCSEAELLTRHIASLGYTEIDLNLGCPFPPIANKGKGSGLLPYPERVDELLKITHRFPHLQFSVKMRLGWKNANESLPLLPVLAKYPLAHITLHPRLGIQQYKGEIDYAGFQRFYNESPHPLLYNGDIKSYEEIRSLQDSFPKLSGTMIGRGLLNHPWLSEEGLSSSTLAHEAERFLHFHADLLESYRNRFCDDRLTLLKMQTFWEYWLPEIEKPLRKAILKSHRIDHYQQAVYNSISKTR